MTIGVRTPPLKTETPAATIQIPSTSVVTQAFVLPRASRNHATSASRNKTTGPTARPTWSGAIV